MRRIFAESIVFVLLWTAICVARDPRADATVQVSVSRVLVATGRPVLPNDFDKPRQTPTLIEDTSAAAIADLERLTHEQSKEIAELERALKDVREQYRATNDHAVKLIADVIELKREREAAAVPPVEPVQQATFGALSLELTTPAGAMAVTDGRYRVIVAVSPSCIYCPAFKARVGSGDERCAVEYVDIDKPQPAGVPDDWWRYLVTHAGNGVPMTTWRDGNGQIRRLHDGTLTLNQIRLSIEAPFNAPPAPAMFNAPRSGYGGAIRTGGRVKALMRAWSDRLGPDADLSLRIDRNGLQRLSVTKLLHGQRWTERDVCGTFGRVGLATSSTRLPGGLQSAGFTYRTLDDGRFVFDAEPLTLRLPWADATETQQAVGAAGLDPLSLGLTMLQVASALYQILNPQVDVGLGGTVSLTAKLDGPDKLLCTFSDCPSIHVAAWFKFDLDVQRIDLTPANAHVQFRPQPRNWIKVDSRDFAINDN